MPVTSSAGTGVQKHQVGTDRPHWYSGKGLLTLYHLSYPLNLYIYMKRCIHTVLFDQTQVLSWNVKAVSGFSISFPAPSFLWLQILCEDRFIAAETEIPEKQLLNQVLDAVKVTPTLHEDLQVEVMKVRLRWLWKWHRNCHSNATQHSYTKRRNTHCMRRHTMQHTAFVLQLWLNKMWLECCLTE